MVANYGKADRGWPDAALQWWLGSANNTWTSNPYTVVAVLGTKSMNPWNSTTIPQTIGNELRKCQFVGICFSWPTNAPNQVGYGGHATTAWGDNLSKGNLSINPTQIRITDSDRDTGGDLQIYNYDSYSNPNPGGANEGNGCYFDYSNNHPYIRCIATLCPTDDPSDNKFTQIVVGSYKIHQNSQTKATDLHYKVGTDVNILSYKTEIDWDEDLTPAITESQPQRREITVDWDLQNKPVPYCTWVTITTEFVLPSWNAIWYKDVKFTYPRWRIEPYVPELHWEIKSPLIKEASKIQDVTGGYVLGSFNVISSEDSINVGLVAEYRLIHQYLYNQSPESHQFLLKGTEGFMISDLKFGHSYGYPSYKQLWKFDKWMTTIDEEIKLGEKKIEIKIDWEGRLPYPKGIDIRDAIKDIRERDKEPRQKK
ncbi:MAG: hypothetical protein JSV32_02750 [Dehalococcoidia bacterium]|nr:MAG: hypothetical protein JSV32_02750 [Dehalococcoidia bacterium]